MCLKKFFVAAVLIGLIFSSCAEQHPPDAEKKEIPAPLPIIEHTTRQLDADKSPADIIYFPSDFPILKMSGKASGAPVARVIYSRPSKDGRKIFGNVVRYGNYWRLGANEGTELEFFRDVVIKGKKVSRGRYILYCIPYEKKWTFKLNSDLYSWGLRIHSALDVYSFDVPVENTNAIFELLTMKFMEDDNGARLTIAWDDVKASLPFKY